MATRRRLDGWIATAVFGVSAMGWALGWASWTQGALPAGAAAQDRRRNMITALPAPGPHPSLGEQARLFDRFVGTWDCDYVEYAADGAISRFKGEVLFGWIIDGRALQDIWIWYDTPQAGTAGERSLGTSLRFFDAKAGLWRVVWVAPASNRVILLEGGAVEERIVLKGTDADGSSRRWSFDEIRDDSFVWRGEVSRDDGKTWQRTGEYQMRRRIAAVQGRTPATESSAVAEPRPPEPPPALRRLDVLVGEWSITGKMEPATEITGRTTFEWLPGGQFLAQNVEIIFGDQVIRGLEIIGYDEPSRTLVSHVFSSLGGPVVNYKWDVRDGGLTISSAAAGFRGRLSADNRVLTGSWEWTRDGARGGYEATMTRIE